LFALSIDQLLLVLIHYGDANLGDKITVGHSTFSVHLWHFSKQKSICSAKLSERQMRTCNRNTKRSLGWHVAILLAYVHCNILSSSL